MHSRLFEFIFIKDIASVEYINPTDIGLVERLDLSQCSIDYVSESNLEADIVEFFQEETGVTPERYKTRRGLVFYELTKSMLDTIMMNTIIRIAEYFNTVESSFSSLKNSVELYIEILNASKVSDEVLMLRIMSELDNHFFVVEHMVKNNFSFKALLSRPLSVDNFDMNFIHRISSSSDRIFIINSLDFHF